MPARFWVKSNEHLRLRRELFRPWTSYSSCSFSAGLSIRMSNVCLFQFSGAQFGLNKRSRGLLLRKKHLDLSISLRPVPSEIFLDHLRNLPKAAPVGAALDLCKMVEKRVCDCIFLASTRQSSGKREVARVPAGLSASSSTTGSDMILRPPARNPLNQLHQLPYIVGSDQGRRQPWQHQAACSCASDY